jgi:hypothetical protein
MARDSGAFPALSQMCCRVNGPRPPSEPGSPAPAGGRFCLPVDRSSWPGQAGAKHLDPLAGMIVPEAIVIEDLEEPDERQNAE